jgi:hypothetical protein
VVSDLKWLDNLSRGPLVTFAAAASAGLTSARVFKRAGAAVAANDALVDKSSTTYQSLYLSNRWIAVRIDVQTSLAAFAVSGLCVAFRREVPIGEGLHAYLSSLLLE